MNVRLLSWTLCGDFVSLFYSDGDTVWVSKEDFDRVFGPIVSASKEDVVRDFALEV